MASQRSMSPHRRADGDDADEASASGGEGAKGTTATRAAIIAIIDRERGPVGLPLEPAVPGPNGQELLRRVTASELRSPRQLNRAVPTELETAARQVPVKTI